MATSVTRDKKGDGLLNVIGLSNEFNIIGLE